MTSWASLELDGTLGRVRFPTDIGMVELPPPTPVITVCLFESLVI